MKFRGCRQRARKIQATRFPIATYPNSSEALVTSLTRVSLPLDRDNEFPPSPQRRIEGISTERPFARSARACIIDFSTVEAVSGPPDGLWRELVPRPRAGRVKRGRMGFLGASLGDRAKPDDNARYLAQWQAEVLVVMEKSASASRSGNAGRFVAGRLGSQLRWHFRVTPKSATQEPADDVNDPEGEHWCKPNGCHDKPILRL